jgi:hypothetical protein
LFHFSELCVRWYNLITVLKNNVLLVLTEQLSGEAISEGQKVKTIFEQAQAKVLREKVVELAVRTVRNTTDVQQKKRHR